MVSHQWLHSIKSIVSLFCFVHLPAENPGHTQGPCPGVYILESVQECEHKGKGALHCRGAWQRAVDGSTWGFGQGLSEEETSEAWLMRRGQSGQVGAGILGRGDSVKDRGHLQ